MNAAAQNNEQTFAIGELAREFNITLRSIRFYEDQGLLQPKRMGTTRIFSRRDRARLQLICRGKTLGFSLKNIKTFLDLYDKNDGQVSQMRYLMEKTIERVKTLEQQRLDLEKALADLATIKSEVETMLNAPKAKTGTEG